MSRHREGTPQELADSMERGVARQQLDRLEIATNYLEQAVRLHSESNQVFDPGLVRSLEKMQDQCRSLKTACSGRVESRRRPRNLKPGGSCTVFLDECGQHLLGDETDPFPVFVVAAAIVRDVDLDVVDSKWKRWKRERLDGDVNVHEPDLRRRRHTFYERDEAIENLSLVLADLEFSVIAVVVHRANFLADYGTGPIDASLPAHIYMMAVDFLMERVVLALEGLFDGGKARLVAESRGAKEDAILQHEFSRLHLEGTSYISPAWFNQQLHAGITFHTKRDNNTGLQPRRPRRATHRREGREP
jgi:hypothetical protein